MKNLLRYLTITTFMFLSFQLSYAQNNTAKEVFTGKELPSLSLNDIYGKKINVADFGKNGKITVISFWATWCSPCKKELNNISYMYEDWQDDYDMELVAISIDDVRNVSKVKTYVNGQAWE